MPDGTDGAIAPAEELPLPLGRPISPLFNIGGAPIAILGGVFSGGLPIAGPVAQVFRGGSAAVPGAVPMLSPSGPIGAFFVGRAGAPIGVDVLGGGGLPIGLPPAAERALGEIQPRTALVGAGPPILGLVVAPVVLFGPARAEQPVPPIGGGGGPGSGGAPI